MSTLPHTTTLLPASAGTGKTFRIVQLLLELTVDEGQDLDRVVVVTFTKAAAGELRERIRHRLVDARHALGQLLRGIDHEAPDPPLQDWVDAHRRAGTVEHAHTRIGALLSAFDDACITTIHGFCQTVLTEAAFEAGAPFATELLADTDTVARDVVADFWIRHTWDAPPATLRSFEALGLKRELLLHLAKVATNPDLRVVPDDPGQPDPVDLTRWRQLLAHAEQQLDPAAQQLLTHTDALARRRNRKKGQLQAITVDRVEKHFRNLPRWFEGNPVPGPELPDAVRELTPTFLAAACKPGAVAPSHPLFDALEAVGAERDALRPALDAWRLSLQHQIVGDTRTRLDAHLRRRNALTYDELLRRVRAPVVCPDRGPALREAVRRRYDAAIVDEFQDTDPDQWDIFRTLFGDRLFLVGDPKQAIYGFRGADFATYLQAEQSCARADSLVVNYRSDHDLVRAVHHLFGRDDVRAPFFAADIELPEVTGARTERGIVGDEGPPLRIRFLPRNAHNVWHGRLTKTRLERDLPQLVANEIVLQLQAGERLRTADGERPIGPGDCAVLTRTNDQARAVAHALVQRGVPAVTRTDGKVWDTAVFADLVHILRAIQDPLKTALVRRALLTDLLGETADALAAMQADHALFAPHALRFRAWRQRWDDQGVLAVVRALLDEGGVAARLLAAGRERDATDLRHLGELLQRASSERRLGPGALLTWIDQGCVGFDDEDVKLRLESDAEAVQCVTVHSAKGLEYPLVWAPWLHAGSWVGPNDLEHLVVPDPEHLALRRLDLGSPEKAALQQVRKDATISEDLRLIYVALTRARHRVVLYQGASGSDAALDWLLHQRDWMEADRAERWRQVGNRSYWKKDQTREARLVEDLDALAVPGLVEWEAVDWRDARHVERWDPPANGSFRLSASQLQRPSAPDRSWARTSFTALTREVHEHEPRPEVDHDADVAEATELPVDPDEAELPLAQVAGGARFGVAVHSILERHDPTAGLDALEPLVAGTLALHDLPIVHSRAVAEQLHRAMQAPLTTGLSLSHTNPSERWNELDFSLPMYRDGGRFRVDRLRRAFDAPLGPGLEPSWRDALDRLDFLPVHGFLVGSIDLVFRHDGRWYLADYKSNRLGPRRADYAPERLAEPMVAAMYPLQYHLYTVALIRLLRSRIPGFDVERDFGGVFYLFVRGMDPAHPGHGVFYDRPPAELITRLDRAIGGEP